MDDNKCEMFGNWAISEKSIFFMLNWDSFKIELGQDVAYLLEKY